MSRSFAHMMGGAMLALALASGLSACSAQATETEEPATVEQEQQEESIASEDEVQTDEGLEQSEDVCMGNVDLRD